MDIIRYFLDQNKIKYTIRNEGHAEMEIEISSKWTTTTIERELIEGSIVFKVDIELGNRKIGSFVFDGIFAGKSPKIYKSETAVVDAIKPILI